MTNPADYRPKPGTIPTSPGVYRFRDPSGRVVYVGKAVNLRQRLQNYFQPVATLHPRTRLMVTTAASVEWTVVRNEVEALILEHTWIKKYDPRFNVVFKDDKSYPYLAVTMNEEFPRMLVMRGERKPGVRYFGPYARAWAIRDTVDTLVNALPMRTCSPATFKKAERQGRPCLLGYIGKCSAPCVGRISPEDHRKVAERVCEVLAGDAKGIIRDVTEQMTAAAAREDFEAAARARDRLTALRSVLERNAVVLSEGSNVDVFSVIDKDMSLVQAAAPQDKQLADLGGKLNNTYVPYGVGGKVGAANQAAQDQYAADSAGYESLRARYAAERAAYHRHVWPDHYTVWSPRRDARLIDTRVELWDGARVGHIDAVARNRSTGDLEAVRVRMDDSGRQVWIDSADLRFDAGHNVVATNLDHADLIRMSQEG